MPEPFQANLDQFDKLILIKTLKYQLLLESIQSIINKDLGDIYTENQAIKIDDVYRESDNRTPIIFILSKGADPSSQIK